MTARTRNMHGHHSSVSTLRICAEERSDRIVDVRSIVAVVVLAFIVPLFASAQSSGTPKWTAKNPPKFEDFQVTEMFNGICRG